MKEALCCKTPHAKEQVLTHIPTLRCTPPTRAGYRAAVDQINVGFWFGIVE
jgi:hypothetical protein